VKIETEMGFEEIQYVSYSTLQTHILSSHVAFYSAYLSEDGGYSCECEHQVHCCVTCNNEWRRVGEWVERWVEDMFGIYTTWWRDRESKSKRDGKGEWASKKKALE
jgi:hypothetical protein